MRKIIELGKVDYNGVGRKAHLATIEVELRETQQGLELSICGNVWNTRRTDIVCGGQCYDTLLELLPGNEKLARIVAIWKRWHLNGMKAGCEHQRELRWSHVTDQTVIGKPCPVCGYKYGTKWLHEGLPAEVIEEVKSW